MDIDRYIIEAESLGEHHITALSSYITRGHGKVNGDLRRGRPNKISTLMTEMMDLLPRSDHMIVHRSMCEAEYDHLLSGGVQTGFLSCSMSTISHAIAMRSDYTVSIDVPAGMPCLLVEPIIGFSSEDEIIFPHGLSFEPVGDGLRMRVPEGLDCP